MKRRLTRWGLLFVVAFLLGAAVGGLLSHTLLYKYASLPFRWLVLASPAVGVLLYWWVDSLEELLGTMSVLIVVAGITTLLAFATPLFLLPSPTVAEQNVLLLDALNRTFMHLGLAAVLVVLGVLVAAVGYRERLVPDRWHGTRGQPNAVLVMLTVTILVIAGVFALPLVRNYGSAVDQRDVEPTVDRACYFPEEETVYVSIAVPNRLADQLWIDSYLLQIEGPWEKPVALRGFPHDPIPPDETGYVEAWVEVDGNVSSAMETPVQVELSGYIYTKAFNEYSTRLDVPPTEVTVRQCGNESVGTGSHEA